MASNPEFLNVHEVMAEASAESAAEREPTSIQTFRLPARVKAQAEEICKGNGTDLSKFLRKCVETLVSDYLPSSKS